MTSKKKKVVVEDSEKVKNLLLQVNLEVGKVMVYSGFSAWDNIAYLLEGVGMMGAQCVKEGMKREEVVEGIYDYLEKVLEDQGFDNETD